MYFSPWGYFRKAKKNYYKISTVKVGIEAPAFLQRIDGHEQSSQPDLILLDLNFSSMHGFDSLARTRTVQELKTIPVCIFTSSESNADIEKANELKADCYLIKPIDLEKFEATFFGFNTN